MKLANRARMTTATSGTGTITLGLAVAGYADFATAGIANGDVVAYCIEDGSAWEIGSGTYTSAGTTLSRTLIASSTGSLLSLSGSAQVFLTPIASILGNLSEPNTWAQNQTFSGSVFLSTAASVTAGTNAQGQGAVTNDVNVVTSTPNNPSGVTLPAASIGAWKKVINKGVNAIIVYPASGAAIDAIGTNGGIQINAGAVLEFWAVSSTQWYSSANFATNMSLALGTLASQNGGTGYSTYTTGDILYAGGTYYMSKLAAGTAGYAVVSNGAASAPSYQDVRTALSALGYATGAGGAVTQATSKSTGVTLNKICGQITMNAAALAAGASVSFDVANSIVTATDTVVLSGYWGTISAANYRIELVHVSAGFFSIRVTNTTAGSRSEAVQINYTVIKGANA